MDAATILSEYVRRHNDGVRSGAWGPLASLFAEDADVSFHGIAVPPMRGRAAIEQVFRTRGPDDTLVEGIPQSGAATAADAVYAWSREPSHVAGVLRLDTRDGRIVRLRITVLPGGPMLPVERDAVRALVLTPDGRLLLLRCREPLTGATWWITPGGGVEPGESDDVAMRRELREEIGLAAPDDLGAPVWVREHVWCWGPKAVRQRERYFLVRTPAAFDPRPALPPEELVREGLDDVSRWWTVDEIASNADVVFAPRSLARHLAALLHDGVRGGPIDVGV